MLNAVFKRKRNSQYRNMARPEAVIILCGKRKCGKDYVAEKLALM
jgi:SpoVK/Ycf46/Vps4 family AAA+-type ATPase